ncbi:hypothetical protein F3P66_09770 [Agrobacterium fabrum]|nr:hypothetical protein F3P66_09770 [Agrobacterium fabrum]TRB31126.1 hypothetical protein EXN51_02910 [Agrobacterium fabrum]
MRAETNISDLRRMGLLSVETVAGPVGLDGRGLPPSALPGISPSRGEIGRRHYCHFIRKR